jgi:replicative DNA helicase
MIDHQQEDHTVSIRAEQSVIGALLLSNDALDMIGDLEAEHFYRNDHRMIFEEIRRQIVAGRRADAMTVFEKLSGSVEDCLKYLATLRQSAVSAANIKRHAEIIADKADKRALVAIGVEMQELGASHQPAAVCVDLMASKIDALAQKKTANEPERMDSMLGAYMEVLEQRMSGAIRPIATGFRDLDIMLDGGMERGTLTVIAGRPGMGKTAAGLGICRNVSDQGSSLFLSMEMARNQVNDRNIAALGKIPIKWLRKPGESNDPKSSDTEYWGSMTHAIQRAQKMNLFIDDQTGLNMMEIRAKARKVKRKTGLDLIVIDQLSFITGGRSDKDYAVVGEHTRGLVALAKELDIAVILLCQLNRDCEKRPNKRPMQADLAISGSIEQDAANIIFLYRDEVYNPETRDKGLCEWISVKQRQGEPGTIALNYIGSQTRFEDLPYQWAPRSQVDEPQQRRGFA